MDFEPTDNTESERNTNWRLIRTPVGGSRSGRARYAAAMYFFQTGEMDADTLEVYRVCAKLDNEDPFLVLRQSGIGKNWVRRLGTNKDRG